MDNPRSGRPETLPEQLARVGANLGRLAWLSRASWTPIVCLLACALVGAAQRLLASGTIAIGLGPWWIDLTVLLLGGFVGTAPMLLGLWTGTGTGSAYRRWGLGVLALLFVAMMAGRDFLFPRSEAGFVDPWFWIGFASQLQLAALWASVGLLIRGIRYGVFSQRRSARSSVYVGVADLMLLTTAFAVGIGANVYASNLLSADQSFETIELSPITQALSLLLGVAFAILPMTPVLIACFPRETLRPIAVLAGAILSFVLSAGGRLAMTAIFLANSRQAGAIPVGSIWNPTQLIINSFMDLGAVAGVIAFSLVLRFGGYGLRRIKIRRNNAHAIP